MSKKNLSKMFLLVTLIILLIGVVSATEVSNDTINTDTTVTADTTIDNLEIIDKSVTNKNMERNLKASTKTYDVSDYNTLHNALTNDTYDNVNVNINSDIKLSGNTVINKSIKTLTINGNGITINGNNKYQFIKINSDTKITISNINIINCNQAIRIIKGDLTIINTTLNNNTLKSQGDAYGGAIYNIGTLNIINSTLTNNTLISYKDYTTYGGAIYNNGSLTITNTTISNNSADIDAIYTSYDNMNSVIITNSILNNNIGGVLSSDNAIITNSTINNNHENAALTIGGNSIITNCTLNYNTLAITTGYTGNITIINSTLNYNKGLYGGAIWNSQGKINIINCTLNNNIAESGGAIAGIGYFNITNSTLNNNQACNHEYNRTDGGAIDNEYGYLNITNSILNNNSAERNGGAIKSSGNLVVINCTITNNQAEYGSAIYNVGFLTLENNTLKNDKGVCEGEIFTNLKVLINSMNVINGKYILTTKVTYGNYDNINSGRVSYTLDGKWIGSVNVKNGSSWVSFNTPPVGNHTIEAKYITENGDIISWQNDGIDMSTDTFTFEKIANVNALWNAFNVKKDKVIIVTTVKDDEGNNINSGRISYSLNDKWIGSVDVKNGSSWISFKYNDTIVRFNATYISSSNIKQNIYTKTLNLTQLKSLKNKNESTNPSNDTQPHKNSSVHLMINSINVLNGKYVLTTKVTDNNYTKLNVGRVSYTLDGKWIGSINVTNGSSWISFNVPNLGNHTIVAKYIDANGKTVTNDTYSFEKKSTVSGVNAVFSAYDVKNSKVIIVTTVKNDKSNPINSGRISYSLNGKWIGSVDVKNGSSWISFNYTNNTVTFKATFITNNNVTQNIYTRTLDLDEISILKKV